MLPSIQHIARMSWRELQKLALDLRQSRRGETFLQTSTRLYCEGLDEVAELYQAIHDRAEVLGRHGDDSYYDTLRDTPLRTLKKAKK